MGDIMRLGMDLRLVAGALALACVMGCAGVRTSFSYTTTEPESLVLVEQPQVGGLLGTHLELQRIDRSTGQPIGSSHVIFLLAENHLVRTNEAGETVGTSEFSKARMLPGDYAVLQITDTMSRYNYIQTLCYDRSAPVVSVAPNTITVIEPMQVLEMRALLGDRYPEGAHDSVAAAREVLRGYPNIVGEPVLAPMVDVVNFEDSGSLGIMRDECDSHTPFRSVWTEIQARGESLAGIIAAKPTPADGAPPVAAPADTGPLQVSPAPQQ